MNSSHTVFLDTSIQIERLIGAVARRTEIEDHLAIADVHFVSSHYVFMEFQRSILADYVRVYNAIHHHESWTEAAHELRSGALAYRPRALGRCLQIMTQAMEHSHLKRGNALEQLTVQIKYDLPSRFWLHVNPVSDAIVCDLIQIGVTSQPDGGYTVADSCRKETALCHLPDFVAVHNAELHTIADYLAAHPQTIKDQQRVEHLLSTVSDDPSAILGQATCWPLGDVIILLQAYPDAMLWTLDADYEPLAAALGLTLYTAAMSE